jgi:exonuclease III
MTDVQEKDHHADDTDANPIIRIANLNIRDGRNTGLEAVLRASQQMKIDVIVLTETKFQNDHHTRSAFGYNIFATMTSHLNQGGIALAHRHCTRWQVESEMRHGPNVISFLITTGQRRFFVIAYIPPTDTMTLQHIHLACGRFADEPMILMGDLNVDLYGTSPDDRATEIIALIASIGLEDMSSHFLQRTGYHHGETWHMLRNGQLISSRCDYILATDRKYFKYAGLREPRYNTDHLMVMGEIMPATRRENFAYLRGRRRFPLKRNKNTTTMSTAYVMFSEFRSLIDTRDEQPTWKSREPWISENTWRLIDQRASRGGNQTMIQTEKRFLINVSGDPCERTERIVPLSQVNGSNHTSTMVD